MVLPVCRVTTSHPCRFHHCGVTLLQVLLRAMEERRAAIAANGGIISRSDGPVCVMDRFLYEQAKQRECGEADGKHGIVFDDGLICDNVSTLD